MSRYVDLVKIITIVRSGLSNYERSSFQNIATTAALRSPSNYTKLMVVQTVAMIVLHKKQGEKGTTWASFEPPNIVKASEEVQALVTSTNTIMILTHQCDQG